MNLSIYKQNFLNYLNEKIVVTKPENLYQPINYILNIGGKRLRPIITLMACELFGKNYKNALPASLAIEVFHNFTLVHDDIMDHANLRRNQQTVHKKWNVNTGILSGDAMLLMANQLFENYNGEQYKTLMKLFNKTAIEVCQGQQYDIDFETKTNVGVADYLNMIKLKTAVLIACSLKMGAIIANASNKDAENIYNYGLNLGIAFQLQDDYLDTFGNTLTFGKKIGGDILENKKTFLFLKVLKLASKTDKKLLLNLFANTNNSDNKINQVTLLYRKYKIEKIIQSKVENYTAKAYLSLENTSLNTANKTIFKNLGNSLLNRIV